MLYKIQNNEEYLQLVFVSAQTAIYTARLTIAEVPETRFLVFAYPSSIATELCYKI
ncbi:hypothetical protein [Scytonema hofmannii]|uniref:hypothetical protein n=1 Tax=Scytonema hofmannii TaxID=34078 RepID=UPI00034CDE8C|nr:hypothetical protein [Scytonema hofmannii]